MKRAAIMFCTVAMVLSSACFALAAEFPKAKLVIGTAGPSSEDNHLYQFCEKMKKDVAAKSGGNIVIEPHYNGALGNERDLLEGVQLGTVDMCIVSSGPLGNFVRSTLAFDFPFLFRDWEHVDKVFQGEIGAAMAKEVEDKSGMKVLIWAVNGFRQLTNSKRAIKAPADLAGLKIRTMENKIHMATFAALGADPTPMSTGELYTSLQQGTVDGMESPLSYILPSKFTEVQKFMSLTNHFYAPSIVVINQGRFSAFPEHVQKMLLETARDAYVFQLDFSRNIDKKMVEAALAQGVEVTPTDQLDMDGFREKTKKVYADNPEFADIIKKIQNVQ